jgi:hypothetical protein
MSSLRPEIEAFVQAAQTLIVMDLLGLSLTEEEEAAIDECLTKLDEQLSSREE